MFCAGQLHACHCPEVTPRWQGAGAGWAAAGGARELRERRALPALCATGAVHDAQVPDTNPTQSQFNFVCCRHTRRSSGGHGGARAGRRRHSGGRTMERQHVPCVLQEHGVGAAYAAEGERVALGALTLPAHAPVVADEVRCAVASRVSCRCRRRGASTASPRRGSGTSACSSTGSRCSTAKAARASCMTSPGTVPSHRGAADA